MFVGRVGVILRLFVLAKIIMMGDSISFERYRAISACASSINAA
jgi:hypothetical protein